MDEGHDEEQEEQGEEDSASVVTQVEFTCSDLMSEDRYLFYALSHDSWQLVTLGAQIKLRCHIYRPD